MGQNLRKKLGQQLSQHHVGICYSERAAAAVAGRPGISPSTVGADAEPCAIEMQDRAAAGGHRMDQHHRRAHAHPGNFRLERALVLAVEMGDVSRGAAHVETDQVFEPGSAARFRHPHHAAGRTRQDRVLALEQVRSREPSGRHHEHQSRRVIPRRQFCGHLRHIAAQDRRQIGVNHSGIAPADEFDQGDTS